MPGADVARRARGAASEVVLELALLCNLAFLAPRRRDCARELIIEGRADLPLRAVQRERSRLRDPAPRRALADGLEAIRETASRPVPSLPAARPMFHARVVAAVDPELAVIARRLRDEAAGTRGVAMAQRLVTDGCSPLYGGSVAALREELHRIMFLLGA